MKTRNHFTLLIPEIINPLRLHLAEDGGGGGGDPPADGQPGDTPAQDPPTDGGDKKFEVPEKFKGATAEESLEKMGKAYNELETKLGKGDQSAAEIAKINQGLAELKEAMESQGKPADETVPDPDKADREAQIQQGKDLGFATDKSVDEKVKAAREEGRKDYEISQAFTNLEKQYDGKDGKPKFDSKEISEYALKNGLDKWHPEKVYKDKFEKELIDWHRKDAVKGNAAPGVNDGRPAKTVPSDGGKKPEEETKKERVARLTKKLGGQ